MPKYGYQWIFLGLQATWLLFVLAFGACAGSLVNVLVYRMPRGLGVVTPPSRCPSCETRLTWRENIPVFGWLLLRGRCRFCKSPISARYPIVEAMVAGLIGLFFVLWYLVPETAAQMHWHDFHWSAIKPEWYQNPPRDTWPEFLLVALLLVCLTAITLMDADTFTIDLRLTWVPAIAAVLVHPLHALWIQTSSPTGRLSWPFPPSGWVWAIPTPSITNWWWTGASIGAVLGLAVAGLLLRAGWIRQSFADMEEWEKGIREKEAAGAQGEARAGGAKPGPAEGPETWTLYPHARREMLKELVFLSPPVTLGFLGGILGRWLGGGGGAPGAPVHLQPLWLTVLTGVLMGYLIGGGVVWLVRIGGSLAFGKEALGLGDVYMMAAVGACVGWINAGLAFFGAAFVGLLWVILGLVVGGKLQRHMPYGPYLAVSTVLVLLLNPLVKLGLTALLRVPAGEWPINIP